MFELPSYIFTTIICFCPILLVYGIGISTITLFDALSFISILLIVIVGFFLKKNRLDYSDISIRFYPFILFISICAIIIAFFNKTHAFRTLRYMYYLYIIMFLLKKFFKKDFGMKLISIIALASTVWLFAQFVCAYIFKVYLTGFIPFLKLINPNLSSLGNETLKESFRPRSFFQEPSFYAIYIIFSSVIVYNSNYKKWFKVLALTLFFAGILIASSTLGIACFLLIFVYYFILKLRHFSKKNIILIITVFCFAVLILVLILALTSYGQNIIRKIFNPVSFWSRFNGYLNLFDFSSFNGYLKIIFGNGMVDRNNYMPGLAGLLFDFGLVGLILFLYSFDANKEKLPFCLLFLFVNLGSEIVLGTYFIFFNAIYLNFPKYNKENANE